MYKTEVLVYIILVHPLFADHHEPTFYEIISFFACFHKLLVENLFNEMGNTFSSCTRILKLFDFTIFGRHLRIPTL